MKSKNHQQLKSLLYDTESFIARENYSTINGGLAEEAGNSSDKPNGYNDSVNKSTGIYDMVVPSVWDTVNTLTLLDKPE